jgi:hypothetical protein
VALAAIAALSCTLATTTWAQGYPVTPGQRSTANQVASSGVALSELAQNAPDSYTIKRGDTLWDISKLFLKSPWRWPELWGMNLDDIKNPHLIYPGQTLFLERKGGMASLRMGSSGTDSSVDGADLQTVRVSPRTRYEPLSANALTSLKSNVIEAFLVEPLVVSESELQAAPRLVSTQENRVLLTRGDRAYVRGPVGNPILDDLPRQKQFRVFREATPLKDPTSGEVLGFEAQYVGKATLARGESTSTLSDKDNAGKPVIVPGTIDITSAKEEMRVGDRILPEPPRLLQSYIPHAPSQPVDARILSVYGSAVVNAAQSQVVAINKGTRDGMEPGHVLAILKAGELIVDKGDPARPLMKLPDERNGLLMVFRTFDRVSYALILEINDGVRVGDRLTAPR